MLTPATLPGREEPSQYVYEEGNDSEYCTHTQCTQTQTHCLDRITLELKAYSGSSF